MSAYLWLWFQFYSQIVYQALFHMITLIIEQLPYINKLSWTEFLPPFKGLKHSHGMRFPWNEDKSKFEIVLHPSSSMWNNFLFLVLNANLPTGKMLCAISILTRAASSWYTPSLLDLISPTASTLRWSPTDISWTSTPVTITSVMIYYRGASLSKQHTDLLICHCTKQDLSHPSTCRYVEKSSPEIARYCIRMATAI